MNEEYAAIMDSIKSEERVFVERLTRIEEKLNIHLGTIQKDVDNAFVRLRTSDERLRAIEDSVKKIEILCPTKFDPWKKIQESFFSWLVPALFAMAVFAIQHGFTK
jgi:hypothetical protein